MFRNSVSLFTFILCLSGNASSQELKRDQRALNVVTQAITAMGGSLPTDLAASGIVTLEDGSGTKQAAIRLSFKNANQSVEEINGPDGLLRITYSKEQAAERAGDKATRVSLELAATSQSALVPLPLLASFLSDPTSVVEYVGSDDVAGETAHHVRLAKSYAGRKGLEHLTEFSWRDVWFMGFRVTTMDGRIVVRIEEAQVRKRYGEVLGARHNESKSRQRALGE